MKRAPDKIKDFVEPQAFDAVQNYARDLPRALAAYRFTDATADLLSRWLDALAELPRERGTARALAGVRGVGKSHTLAAFGALAGFSNLRLTVTDAHLRASAGRLLNRNYAVAVVERGSCPTLAEEISAAFAKTFGGRAEEWWKTDVATTLAVAAQTANAPLVVIVDTAFDRTARVERDDGALLSELARATAQTNAFVALALDDDISGADGPNIAIAGAFQIDYLDPEHLYHIVDVHLFQKTAQARAALQDVYAGLRADVPGFNWSEPRFAALYPVHPLIAEVAAAVRLYVPAFAFLSFAAQAGAHASNRPALSLIVLDEVFDRTESELRKAEGLKTVFAAYDEVASKAIARLPIMQRLEAKLVLKGLFILSLDGRGATARELGAAMLLYDKAQPLATIERIENILTLFAENAPRGALEKTSDKDETSYRFLLNAANEFDAALGERLASIAPDSAAIDELLAAVARARFEDWPLTDENNRALAEANFAVAWRGTLRRGRLTRQTQNDLAQQAQNNIDASAVLSLPSSPNSSEPEWEVAIAAPPSTEQAPETVPAEYARADNAISAVWRHAPLTFDDTETLRRLLLLRTDEVFLAAHGEAAQASTRAHTALAERIWSRIYLDDGTFQADAGAESFTQEAKSAATLHDALAQMLEPLFTVRYPQHPVFTATLNEQDVARLVGGLFGGANQGEASVQELARLFAAPLGLASLRGGTFTLEAGDQALKQPWIREVIAMTDEAGGGVVSLDAVNERLRRAPYGLRRETQHLIFAALVAQRRIELVTSNDDRISRRTLDISLKWAEVAGIARAATLLHSAEELTAWARLLTGETALASIANPEARENVRLALAAWLKEWQGRRLLEKFDALPDEGLTTRAWDLAALMRKSFATAADAVESTLDDTFSLEEGLQRVADAFGDAPEIFAARTKQLAALMNFTVELDERERARTYLALVEPSALNEIESARRELQTIADDVHNLFDQESIARFKRLWQEFHARYTEHYAAMHDETIGTISHRRAIDEFTRGEAFRDFEALSQLSIINRSYWEEVSRLLERAQRAYCTLPVRQILMERPLCDCSFRLAHAASIKAIAPALEDVIARGREAHRRTLALWSEHLAHALEALKDQNEPPEIVARAADLAARLRAGDISRPFSPSEIQLIETAIEKTGVPPLRVVVPAGAYGLLTRDELGARLKQWLDDLPNYPALVDVAGESSGNAE